MTDLYVEDIPGLLTSEPSRRYWHAAALNDQVYTAQGRRLWIFPEWERFLYQETSDGEVPGHTDFHGPIDQAGLAGLVSQWAQQSLMAQVTDA